MVQQVLPQEATEQPRPATQRQWGELAGAIQSAGSPHCLIQLFDLLQVIKPMIKKAEESANVEAGEKHSKILHFKHVPLATEALAWHRSCAGWSACRWERDKACCRLYSIV